ncbi:hypothetical protein NECAME_16069 [Necator americanus]|uniref:Uncharacterized protein n=1 Tax=Necator americanus TaxID=51031 RepID=W2TXU6_NECAM|nr:hypothetical protein NECAME_16069 [Necator americanus]ETN86885.1 hypothetical protein NECAME_16069 [Necator americanus]
MLTTSYNRSDLASQQQKQPPTTLVGGRPSSERSGIEALAIDCRKHPFSMLFYFIFRPSTATIISRDSYRRWVMEVYYYPGAVGFSEWHKMGRKRDLNKQG